MLQDRNGERLRIGDRVQWRGYLTGVVVSGETRPHMVNVRLDKTPDELNLIDTNNLEKLHSDFVITEPQNIS